MKEKMKHTYKCINVSVEKGALVYYNPEGERIAGFDTVLNYFGNNGWKLISVFDLVSEGETRALGVVFEGDEEPSENS